jgi:citrate lyase subunit beta/citryl-CoA lyase
VRSLLFAGATRPDLVAKLPRSGPDAVAIDLEDAVPEPDKETARAQARAQAQELAQAQPSLRVFIRVNGPGTAWIEDDLRAVATPALAGVVVPKVERPADVAHVRAVLGAAGADGLGIVAGLETARGVRDAGVLMAEGLDAVYFGAEDFIADLGGHRTPGGLEVLYARSQVVLAARIAGVTAIDQAVVVVRDDERFRRDAEQGRALGYHGKLCVHPSQVAIANGTFGPSDADRDRARRLVEAWRRGAAAGVGAVEFEGAMIDAPAVRMAQRILEEA